MTGASGMSSDERPVWSDSCQWTDLAMLCSDFEDWSDHLAAKADWKRCWTAKLHRAGRETIASIRDIAELRIADYEPVRHFSWRRNQVYRPGLHHMVSTGRHHGFESLDEARVLMMLDFAGDATHVLSQPMELGFIADGESICHIPDFLVDTRMRRWLIDVHRPDRMNPDDQIKFAAAARVAAACGWSYAVVTGWRSPMWSTVDAFSAQRRPLVDHLELIGILTQAASRGPSTFGELARVTAVPVIARAFLLHLLWHRRLGVDLVRPLGDRSVIRSGARADADR